MTNLFMTLLDMSLKGSFVIFTVCLTRWVLMFFRYPRRFCYLLWGIVLLRLLMPVSIASPLSRLPDDFTESITAEWADDYVGDTRFIHDVSPDFDTAVAHGISPITDNQGHQYVVTAKDGISQPATVKTEWFPILTALWGIGVAAMVLWNLLALLRLRKQLAEAIPTEGNVWICDSIQTAFVVGLFRPRIYLPSSLSEEARTHILRHEQYHIRKKDHITKLFAFAALCLHWFNPPVWLAYKLAMVDMELRCDEAVTADLAENDKADYAQTLLDMTTGQRHFQIAPVAFGEGDTANRVRHVLGSHNTTKLAAVLAVCLLIFTAVGMLTDPKERNLTFGASLYGYERIAYEDYYHRVSKPPYSFCLTTDNVFWALDHSYGWQELGVADLYEVTADEIYDMMPYHLAKEDPVPITRVTDSKIVRFTDDNGHYLFYLLTRHEEGKHYIAYGVSESKFYEPDKLTIHIMYPALTGVGQMSSNGPFYVRCLESMLDVGVDVFSTYHAGDGWQIVGFRTGVPKTNYGWAVFRIKDNAATFTGQMQLFENAPSINNGILLSSPAVCSDTGELTDKTAYDVILVANPDVSCIRVRMTGNVSKKQISYSDLSAPAMVVVPWSVTAKADSVAYECYNAAGVYMGETQAHSNPSTNHENALLGNIAEMTAFAEALLKKESPDLPKTLSKAVNIGVFRGTHDMVQFNFSSLTNQYSGYYYSPDDVPLPFQNANVTLTETENGWTWQDEGDNHGTTERIAKQWFRYTANL